MNIRPRNTILISVGLGMILLGIAIVYRHLIPQKCAWNVQQLTNVRLLVAFIGLYLVTVPITISILNYFGFFNNLLKTGPNGWWAVAVNVLCITLVIFTFMYICFERSGWDFRVYLGAVEAYHNGLDPYYVKNTIEYYGNGMPFVYAPITLIFFRVLDLFGFEKIYFIIWTLALLITFLNVRNINRTYGSSNNLLIVTILSSAFVATMWNFTSGNIGLIELAILSTAMYAVHQNEYSKASILFSFASIFKIVPVILGASLFWDRLSVRNLIRPFALLILSFALIQALNFCLYPDISRSYYQSVTGQLQGQQAPIDEDDRGTIHPCLFFAIGDFLELFMDRNQLITMGAYIMASCFVIIIPMFLLNKFNIDRYYSFNVGILCILAILPRLKPYSLSLALVSAVFIINSCEYKKIFYLLNITCTFPLIGYVMYRTHLLTLMPRALSLIFSYSQLFSLLLLITYSVVLVLRRNFSPLVSGDKLLKPKSVC